MMIRKWTRAEEPSDTASNASEGIGQRKTRLFSPRRILSMTEGAFRACIEVTYGKRLAILEGGYMGLVPGHAAVGDFACILFGCSLPIMLRKDDDHYILVGESYFHGVTDGDVILDYEKHFETEQFSIR